VLTLETAIKKMTAMPAEIMGLNNRGRLLPDYMADITIFDPDTNCDTATFERPHQYPNGIEKVILAGEIVIDNGNHTSKMPGRIIT